MTILPLCPYDHFGAVTDKTELRDRLDRMFVDRWICYSRLVEDRDPPRFSGRITQVLLKQTSQAEFIVLYLYNDDQNSPDWMVRSICPEKELVILTPTTLQVIQPNLKDGDRLTPTKLWSIVLQGDRLHCPTLPSPKTSNPGIPLSKRRCYTTHPKLKRRR